MGQVEGYAKIITTLLAFPTLILSLYLTFHYMKVLATTVRKNTSSILCIFKPPCSIAIIMVTVFFLFSLISLFNMGIRTLGILGLNGGHFASVIRSALTQLVAFGLSVLFIHEKNNGN